jgi:aryl-alcohol dehydrogenase-like predicted oxidoreductase
MRSDLDRFRRELDVDMIDILLMHCPTDVKWNAKLKAVMDVLSEAKRKGIVRATGVSPHSWGALLTASVESWVDVASKAGHPPTLLAAVILIRLNYAGVNMDNEPKAVIPVLKRIQAAGKGVYAMKAFGAGRLSDARRCLSFALSAPVDALTVGMETRAQVDGNVRMIEESSAGS